MAVVNAKEHDRGSFRFEGKLTEAHRSMSNNVAKEIIRQLGGRRFEMMTGAKKFIKDINETILIVNFTNDAWFGDTIGPHQHFINTKQTFNVLL